MAKKHFNGSIQEQVFKEYPIVDRLHVKPNAYDITGKHVNTFDFMDSGRFSFNDYSKALLIAITGFANSEIPDFISYQLTKIEDRKRWLYDLERLIELNQTILNDFKPGVVDSIKAIIKDFLQDSDELISPSEQRLIWNEDPTALLELITALSESGLVANLNGKVVKKDIRIAFEQFFGVEIKNPAQSSSQFKTRHKKHPVLDRLTTSFQRWLDKPKNK